MKSHNQLRRAFVLFHLVLAAVVFIGGAHTAATALGLMGGHGFNLGLLLLGGAEAALAIAFLLPPTVRAGAVGLIAVLTLAVVLHALAGEFRGSLIVYAAAAAFVGAHGSAYCHRTPGVPADA